ncbi:MAG: GNAT family N-acetyltransferase [Acidimicrobiales bacterium]
MSRIRPFADDELAGFSDVHGPDRDAPRRSRTFVAEVDGVVVGAATALWSSRHPDLVAAMVDVAENHRRRGIGSALVHRLDVEADRPLVFNVERTPDSTAFLHAHGYSTVVTSVTARVSTAAALETLEELPGSVPNSIRIEPNDELATTVIDLYEQIYAERHRWAGSYSPPPDTPWINFAGPPLGATGTIQVARADGNTIGVVSLHSGHFADGADAFLAPTSILVGSLDERVATLARLVEAALRAGLDAGIRHVNVEYDTPYDDLTALVESWTSDQRTVRDAWLRI